MIIDSESDGLWYECTKLHVLGWWDEEEQKAKSTHDYNHMRDLLLGASNLTCHNVVRHDIKVFENILDVDLSGVKLYDTLAMSWALFPGLSKHGLEEHGRRYGVPKPKINDWRNLSPEEYAHRVREDVLINKKLWDELVKKGLLIYQNDREELDRYFQYLTFKMKCAAEQEDNPVTLDMPRVERNIEELTTVIAEKKKELEGHMPQVVKYKTKEPPKKPYKNDGTLSSIGQRWLDEGGDPQFKEPLELVDEIVEPNAGAHGQVKDWLFSMGWEPCTYKYERNSDGTERGIPQVRYPTNHPQQGELTESVLRLAEDNPSVRVLEGLTVAQHRLGVFEGFRDCAIVNESGDYALRAEIAGFTNTLRFKHKKPLVNLPGVDKPYGEEIRGSLIAPEGYVFCGTDMASLESCTKRHYMWEYDPEYVTEMSQEGFDEHLDLAKHAGELSEDDYDAYTQAGDNFKDSDDYKRIKKTRTKFKPANYSCVYGVGRVKLSRTTGLPEQEAQGLIDAYWQRNWAVKEVAEAQTVRKIGGELWMLNPVSGFWYSLRYQKDRFSTLNQGTGVYCFDTWLAYCCALGVTSVMQFHDEHCDLVREGEEELHTEKLTKAIGKANDKLKLNVELGISIDYGKSYAEVH